jgi:putative selenium metabolism hydrolase
MTTSGLKLDDQHRTALTAFLADLVSIPSPSSREGQVAERILQELRTLGLSEVQTDRIGNVIGRVGPGHGPVLMLNGHMDTVRVSDETAWSHAPFGAEIEHGRMYGIGAADMKGGLAAMVYGTKLLIDSGVSLGGDVVVACVVQEEQCEGVGSRVLVEEDRIQPDWVVLGEPTGLSVFRGQRGRLEMHIVTHGHSAHAARPDLGENAVYTAARLVFGLELLASQLAGDAFLGPGTLAVTSVSSQASSRNAIPDRCELIVDRRLTSGENETMAIAEVQRLIAREGVNAQVDITEHDIKSYSGCTYHARASYPAWVISEDDPLVQAAVRAARAQLGRRPRVGHWDFSTEGVYTAQVAGIPTVGFGPGDPQLAHTSDENVEIADVVSAAEVYAQLALELLGES